MTSRKESKSIAALSSSICSICSAVLVNPLEVLKIRQQSQHQSRFFKLSIDILKNEGFMTFYNGFSYTLITNGISIGAYLFVYDLCKVYLMNNYKQFHDENRILFPLVTSGISRLTTSTLFFPFECLKTVKQSLHGFNWIHFNDLFKQQGLKAYSITLQRDILLAQIYWVCAENLKLQLSRSSLSQNIQNIAIGGLSGTIAAILTLPFDVVKTLKQTNIEYSKKSYLDISKDIYLKNKGFSGFFLGYQPRVLKVSIHGAVLISSYEFVYNQIHKLYSNN